MEDNIRRALTLTSRLDIDKSVFSKLEEGIQLGIIPKDKYNHLINQIIRCSSNPNMKTKDIAVSQLILQLSKHVHNDIKLSQVNVTPTNQNPPQPQNNNLELLEILNKMSKKLDSLENNRPTTYVPQNYHTTEVDPSTPITVKEETVFIDPLDKTKLSGIKSNVNIDSEQGNNIADRLSKLKKLKGDK